MCEAGGFGLHSVLVAEALGASMRLYRGLYCALAVLALASPVWAQSPFPWDTKAAPSAAPSKPAVTAKRPPAPTRDFEAPAPTPKPAVTSNAAALADTRDLDAARTLRDRKDYAAARGILEQLLQRSPGSTIPAP